jgi:cell division protein FtsA
VIPRAEICEIVQPRMAEIFSMVKEKIAPVIKSRQLSGNVILSGGGALLPGAVELASEVFNTQAVRIGIPGNFGGLTGEYRSPDYATVLGLVLAAYERRKDEIPENGPEETVSKPVIGRIRGWLKEFF